MKRALSFILAVIMLLPALAACGDTGSGTETTTPDVTTTAPDVTVESPITDDYTETTEASTTTVGKTDSVLPDVKYENYTFRVLSKVNYTDPTGWGSYDIVYEKEAPIVATELKEAIRNRNAQLKDKLGVDIELIHGGWDNEIYQKVYRSVARGNDEYDMVLLQTSYAAQLAQKGHLASVQNDLTYLDADSDRYDQRAMDSLKLSGKNYFFFSDITVVNLDATWLYYFNAGLIDKYDLTDPYELLADGDWTLDTMLEMCEKATHDNGDDVMTKEDFWGIAGHDYILTSTYHGTGEKIAETGADGKITLTMNSPKITEYIQKILKLQPYWCSMTLTTTSFYPDAKPYGFAVGDDYDDLTHMFASGHALFLGEVLANSRDLYLAGVDEDEYIGMLPTPKLNKDQKEYYTPVNYIAPSTCVPTTSCGKDLAKASIIIEAWARESTNTVRRVYVEQCQKSRYAKDKVSEETIELIFNSVSYDIGASLDCGKLAGRLTAMLYMGDGDFTSLYKQHSSAAQKELDDFVSKIK